MSSTLTINQPSIVKNNHVIRIKQPSRKADSGFGLLITPELLVASRKTLPDINRAKKAIYKITANNYKIKLQILPDESQGGKFIVNEKMGIAIVALQTIPELKSIYNAFKLAWDEGDYNVENCSIIVTKEKKKYFGAPIVNGSSKIIGIYKKKCLTHLNCHKAIDLKKIINFLHSLSINPLVSERESLLHKHLIKNHPHQDRSTIARFKCSIGTHLFDASCIELLLYLFDEYLKSFHHVDCPFMSPAYDSLLNFYYKRYFDKYCSKVPCQATENFFRSITREIAWNMVDMQQDHLEVDDLKMMYDPMKVRDLRKLDFLSFNVKDKIESISFVYNGLKIILAAQKLTHELTHHTETAASTMEQHAGKPQFLPVLKCTEILLNSIESPKIKNLRLKTFYEKLSAKSIQL